MASFKKIGCAVLLAPVLVYAVWVSLPTSHYKKEIAQICLDQQRDFDLLQSTYATDPARNSFLDPTLHETWCYRRELKEYGGNVTPGAVSRAIKAFNECNPIRQTGLSLAHLDASLKKLKKSPAQLKAARKPFVALLPKIESAMEKPVWCAPSTGPEISTLLPNLLPVRTLAQALAFEAWLEARDKRPDDGAKLALSTLRFGLHVARGNAALIQVMVATVVQAIAFRTLDAILVDQSLQVATLQQIVDQLGQDALPQDSTGRGLAYEMLCQHNSLKQGVGPYLRGAQESPGAASFLSASGLFSRELRMLDNDYYPFVRSCLGDPVDLSWQKEAYKHEAWSAGSIWSDIKGQHGLFAQAVLPNFQNAPLQIKLLRTELNGLRALAAVELFKQKNHRYPASLAEVGLNAQPEDELSSKPFQYSLKAGKPHLMLPIDPEFAEHLHPKDQPEPQTVPRWDEGGLSLTP